MKVFAKRVHRLVFRKLHLLTEILPCVSGKTGEPVHRAFFQIGDAFGKRAQFYYIAVTAAKQKNGGKV